MDTVPHLLALNATEGILQLVLGAVPEKLSEATPGSFSSSLAEPGAVLPGEGAEKTSASVVSKPRGVRKVALPLKCAQEWRLPSQGAELLTPALHDILVRLDIGPEQITHIACVTGPGSFTGIRLTTTSAGGLAMATGALMGAIPYLPLLAHNAFALAGPLLPPNGVMWVVTHARRGLVHAQSFCYASMDRSPKQMAEPHQFSKISHANQVDQVDQVTQADQTNQILQAPQAPQAPQIPQISQALQTPQTLQVPQVPQTSQEDQAHQSPRSCQGPQPPQAFQSGLVGQAENENCPRAVFAQGNQKSQGRAPCYDAVAVSHGSCIPQSEILVVGLDELVSLVASGERPAVLLGSGVTRNRELFEERFAGLSCSPVFLPESYDVPQASVLYEVACSASYGDRELMPEYVRPSDAEESLADIAVKLGLDAGEVMAAYSAFQKA